MNTLKDRISACGRLAVKELTDGQVEQGRWYLAERTGLEDSQTGTYRNVFVEEPLRAWYDVGFADGTKLRELEQAEVKT